MGVSDTEANGCNCWDTWPINIPSLGSQSTSALHGTHHIQLCSLAADLTRGKDCMGVIGTFQQRIDSAGIHGMITKVITVPGSGPTSQFSSYHLLLYYIVSFIHETIHEKVIIFTLPISHSGQLRLRVETTCPSPTAKRRRVGIQTKVCQTLSWRWGYRDNCH